MNFEEYYEQLSSEDVLELNRVWSISGSDCGVFAKEYLRGRVINFFFNKEYFRKSITGEVEEIFIGERSLEYLKYKVLGLEIPYNKEIEYLRKKYILFQDIIPDDFSEIILEYVISKARIDNEIIEIINSQPIDVKSTPFLKLILMLNYVHKNKLDVKEMFKATDIEKGLINRNHIIAYLQTRKLLTDDGRYIDSTMFNKWIKNKEMSIKDFYKFIMTQLNVKGIFDLINIIIKVFERSGNWVRVKEFRWIFNKYEVEVKIGFELGLILIKEYNEEFYVKVSPEAWYMIEGNRPEEWNKKEILVTPLKEVFIPYDFDPFVIQVFDYFRETEVNKKSPIMYSDEYFIKIGIKNINGINNRLELIELVNYTEDYCADIPDVFRYEVLLKK